MKMYERSYARQKVGVANPIESSELFNFIGEKKKSTKNRILWDLVLVLTVNSCIFCLLNSLL